jgi:undecaprenyl-diphosphatase
MNGFDASILGFIARHSFVSPGINFAIGSLAGLYIAKGLLLVAALWWLWFSPDNRAPWRREVVIATFASGLVALIVGRGLAYFLPFRSRPRFNSNLHFTMPVGARFDEVLRSWSSFPSDHAMIWMAVSMGIFIVWKRAGFAALAYTLVFICLPRVYLGLHYPTDIIAGALLGMMITYLLTRDEIRPAVTQPVMQLINRYPGPSGALAFIICFELVSQFDKVRQIAQYLLKSHSH